MNTQDQITWLCLAMFNLVGLSLQQKANMRLDVEPPCIQVAGGTPVKLTCTLSDGDGGTVPLAGCGFRDNQSGTTWEYSVGSATINNIVRGYQTMGIIKYEEHAGRCSLKITGLDWGSPYILGCRVKPAVGGAWLYATMMVYVSADPLPYQLQPRLLVSLPGSDATFTGLAEAMVHQCHLYLPPDNTEIILHDMKLSENTTQYRAWRKGKRCGVTLLNVRPEDSGFVTTEVWNMAPYRSSNDWAVLRVATPPVSPPLLSVNNTGPTFHAGDMLYATCVVEESRPVSNITWLLGSEVVRKDNLNEAPAESTWRWSHEPQMIMQRLSRRLTQQDDGKELKCRAEHLALPSGILDSKPHIIRLRA